MAVRVVLLDFGNTLVVTARTAEFWACVMEELGIPVSQDRLEGAIREADLLFVPTYYDYRGRMREFWTWYDRIVLGRLGLADPTGRSRDGIERGFGEGRWHHPFPETREVLESLRSMGFRLGIVSNNTEDIHRTLRAFDLTRYFHSVTYSQEARAEKPDPVVFRLALERAGCRPSDAVHVGDVYEADVVGARDAGIAPVLVDRAGRHPYADCPRLRDLRGLPALLDARNF